MNVDLTPREIRALLWHIHTVDLAYGSEPPEGSVIATARRKLEQQLNPASRELRPVVVRQGAGW